MLTETSKYGSVPKLHGMANYSNWRQKWADADYSWEGLSKKPLVGWKVVNEGRASVLKPETVGSGGYSYRPANLQDYWRADARNILRSDIELMQARILFDHSEYGLIHQLHNLDRYGQYSVKEIMDETEKYLLNEIIIRRDKSGITSFDCDNEVIGADHRLILDGSLISSVASEAISEGLSRHNSSISISFFNLAFLSGLELSSLSQDSVLFQNMLVDGVFSFRAGSRCSYISVDTLIASSGCEIYGSDSPGKISLFEVSSGDYLKLVALGRRECLMLRTVACKSIEIAIGSSSSGGSISIEQLDLESISADLVSVLSLGDRAQVRISKSMVKEILIDKNCAISSFEIGGPNGGVGDINEIGLFDFSDCEADNIRISKTIFGRLDLSRSKITRELVFLPPDFTRYSSKALASDLSRIGSQFSNVLVLHGITILARVDFSGIRFKRVEGMTELLEAIGDKAVNYAVWEPIISMYTDLIQNAANFRVSQGSRRSREVQKDIITANSCSTQVDDDQYNILFHLQVCGEGEAVCRHLRGVVEAHGSKVIALELLRQENEARHQVLRLGKKAYFEFFVSWMLRTFSNYGTSIGLPLAWLIVLFVLCVLAVVAIAPGSLGWFWTWPERSWATGFEVALSRVFPFGAFEGASKEFVSSLDKFSPGQKVAVRSILTLVSLLSGILLFLSALAARRMFQTA